MCFLILGWMFMFRLVCDRHYTWMHTRSISFNGLLLMSRFVFRFPWNPFYIHLVPSHWVVQIPGREKSSKWKYKDDEGGKKDAEKEKTRSRKQESSMHQIVNEWRFQNSHDISLCNYALSCSYFGL